MDSSFSLQLAVLLLGVYQVLALGSADGVITVLQSLSAVVGLALFWYAMIAFPSDFQLNRRSVPNLWRFFLVLVCLASLLGFGCENSVVYLVRRILTYLLAGIGGVDAWEFQIPSQFRASRNPSASATSHHDRIGYLCLDPKQQSDYDDQCTLVESLQRTIASQAARIRGLDGINSDVDRMIEHRDVQICRLQTNLTNQRIHINRLEEQVGQWRRHRCPLPVDQYALVSLQRKVESLESALASSKHVNETLHSLMNARPSQQAPRPVESSIPQRRHRAIPDTATAPIVPQATTLQRSGQMDHSAQTMASQPKTNDTRPPPITMPDPISVGWIRHFAQIANARPTRGNYPHPTTSEYISPCPQGHVTTSSPSAQDAADANTSSRPASPEKPSAPPSRAPDVPGEVEDLGSEPEDLAPPAKLIAFTCICDGSTNELIHLEETSTFGDLENAWINRKGVSILGWEIGSMEYGTNEMELDRKMTISELKQISSEGKAVVHFGLQ